MIFPLVLNPLPSLDASMDHAGAEGLDHLASISVNRQILQSCSDLIDSIYFLCVRHHSNMGKEL